MLGLSLLFFSAYFLCQSEGNASTESLGKSLLSLEFAIGHAEQARDHQG